MLLKKIKNQGIDEEDEIMGNFIIYGAGERGKWCLDFLKWRKMDDCVVAFCDRKYEEYGNIDGKKVLSYEEAKEMKLPFLISCANDDTVKEVLSMITNDECEGYIFDEFYKILEEAQEVFLREWCAYHHARHNDRWFDEAEQGEAIAVFWNENTPFYHYFKELNLQNVIELACGRGRHVPHYRDMAGKITLVDILEENMIICKERFKDVKNIVYYRNNGYNLQELADNSYTALFTYDSVVHFEMMDVYEYLKDIYRVLEKGGKALFHHSNYSADYKADFAHAPGARCFMNKNIFAYLANRAGFRILDQTVIDWYGVKDLDCISLLEK